MANPPPEIDFVNSWEESFSSEYLASNIFQQRVRGTFVNNMDFHAFPFEKISLKVDIEPVTPWTTKNVILKVDPKSGINESANVPGWFVSEPKFTISNYSYGVKNEEYSRYTAEFVVERSPLGSFLKLIFPVLIVVAMSFTAYIIREHYEVVAAFALLPLLAVVFLHISALEQIPPLGYLTIFDKMMVMVYAVIANNVVATGRRVKTIYVTGKDKEWVVNRFHLKIAPIIVGVLGVILFVLV